MLDGHDPQAPREETPSLKRDLSEGPVLRGVLAFGLPLALAMASQALFNLVDLVLVGRLGEDALAGVHLGSTLNFFPMILGNGISVGAVALVGQTVGRKQEERARREANLSFGLMLLTGLFLGGLAWWLAAPSVLLLEARGQSLLLGTRYLEIMSLGTVTMFGLMHVTGILRAAGNAFWTVVLLVGTNALNIVLDVFLIFGYEPLGIPAYGVAGAAWATVAARLLGCVLGFWVLSRSGSPLRPGWQLPQPLRRSLHRMSAIGIFQTIQMLARAALVLSITLIGGGLMGRAAHGALSVAIRLDTLVLFAGVGWASAATAMVAQTSAAGNLRRCLQIARTTALLSGCLSLAVGLVFYLYSDPIFRFFSEDPSPELMEVGRQYFAYLAFAYPAATASLVLAGSMNGVGRSFLPMMLDLVFFGLLLQPLLFSWYLSGATGGLAVCWFLILLVTWCLLLAYLWVLRKPQLLRPGASAEDQEGDILQS